MKNEQKFNTGLIPSKLDKRDVLTSEIFPEIKRISESCPSPFDLTILNQGNYPHCVGYSAAALKQDKELRERIFKVFDGSWIYLKCKEIDGLPNMAGTFFRAGLKVLQKQGAKPINEPEEEAIKYKIGGYALVDDNSFEGLKKAIFVNGSLLAGFRGTNAGWQTAYVKPPKTGEQTWGHAILLVGYNKDYIVFQNSWGNWGDNGFGYISKEYMPYLIEAWAVLTDYPTEALEFKEARGWTALEFLKPAEYKVGDVVVPTVSNLRLRFSPMGIIIGYVPQKECQILEIGPKKSNYQWVRIGF